jgi:hypothetical protein
MNLGFLTETTTETSEFDPKDEFRKGVELLKNDYPQRPWVAACLRSDKHMPTIIRFLVGDQARTTKKDQAAELCEIAVSAR